MVWAALLRGVNVGGAGKLPMAEFRALLADLGLGAAQTHIQSGNAVFTSTLPRQTLIPLIADGVQMRFGFRPAVFLFSIDELHDILTAQPFADHPAEKTHAFLLSSPVPDLDPAAITAFAAATEHWHLTDAAFYLFAPDGIGRSRLAAGLGRLLPRSVTVTARNLRTLQAVLAMARHAA